MAADAEVVATCAAAARVYDVPPAVYPIAISVFKISPLENCLLVVPPAAVPDFSYFTNMVRSLVESAAWEPTTFATTSEVAPVSVFPIKLVLKFSTVCVTVSTVNVVCSFT